MPDSDVLLQAERVNALLIAHEPELAGVLVPVITGLCVTTYGAMFPYRYPMAQAGGTQ